MAGVTLRDGLKVAANVLLSTRKPMLAHLVVTRYCNLDCAYCSEYDKVSKPVPLELLLERVDRLAALGVTAPALYGHVKDKQDLLRAVAEDEFDRLIARFDEVTDTDPVARIRGYNHAYVTHARENPDTFRVMFLFPPDLAGAAEVPDDVVLPGVKPAADGSVTVEGSVTIRDLNRAMNWDLPDQEAVTVAGLLIHETRRIPEAGQTFTAHRQRFAVLERKGNQVTRLRIWPAPDILDS